MLNRMGTFIIKVFDFIKFHAIAYSCASVVFIYLTEVEKLLRGYVVVGTIYLVFITSFCVMIAKVKDLYDKFKNKN